MNALAADGFVVVGGPLEGTGDTLLVMRAESEAEIEARLQDDPWGTDMLKISRIAPWSPRSGEWRLAGDKPV
jgi:hypothetical protein